MVFPGKTKFLLLLFIVQCSTSSLVPLMVDQYDQLKKDEIIHVYLKNDQCKIMTDCVFQISELQGVWLNPESGYHQEIRIPGDSIEFMMGEEKLINDIVPLKFVDSSAIEREEKIYIVLNDSEIQEIWDPHLESPYIREGGRYHRWQNNPGGFHLDSIRALAVKGILDPWGDAISYHEIKTNYTTRDRYIGLLIAMSAFLPSLVAGMYLADGITELTVPFTFWIWAPLAYIGFTRGTDRGLKTDRNIALEKILRNRAKMRADSSFTRDF